MALHRAGRVNKRRALIVSLGADGKRSEKVVAESSTNCVRGTGYPPTQVVSSTNRDRAVKEIGWTKGRELAKLARRDGQHFDCAPWVHKAREMPREEFRREVEKELTGREEEPSELIYFKVYKAKSR